MTAEASASGTAVQRAAGVSLSRYNPAPVCASCDDADERFQSRGESADHFGALADDTAAALRAW